MKREVNSNMYLTVLLILCLSGGCHRVGSLGRCSSTNIEWSKKKGLYLCEYIPSQITINDSIQFSIKEAFAEKQFGQYSYSNPSYTIEEGKSQLIMILEQKICLLKGYSDTWLLDANLDKPNILSLLFDKSVPPDTIKIDVERRDIDSNTGLAGKRNHEKIGQFTLIKKR